MFGISQTWKTPGKSKFKEFIKAPYKEETLEMSSNKLYISGLKTFLLERFKFGKPLKAFCTICTVLSSHDKSFSKMVRSKVSQLFWVNPSGASKDVICHAPNIWLIFLLLIE
jgi:hypothetical protein